MLSSSTPTSCEELPFESTRKPLRVGLQAVPSPWASALPPTAPDFSFPQTRAARESPNAFFQARKPQSAKRAMSVGCQVVFSSHDATTSTFYSRTDETETSVEVCPHCLREGQLQSPRFPGWPFPWFSPTRLQFPFPAGSLCTCASPFSALLPPPYPHHGALNLPYPNYRPPNLPYFPSLPSYPFCYYPQHPIVMPFDVWLHSNPSIEEGPAIMECVVEPFEGYVPDEEVDRSVGTPKKHSPPSKITSVTAVAASGSVDALSSRVGGFGLPEARPKPAGCTPKSASPATRGVELPSATVEGAGESDKSETVVATPLEVQKDETAGSTGSPAGTASGVDLKPTEEWREGGNTGSSLPLEAATKAADVPGSGALIQRSSTTPNGVPEQAPQAHAAKKTADPKVNFKSPGSSKPTSSSLTESDLTSSTGMAVGSLPGNAGSWMEQLDTSPNGSPGTRLPDPKDEVVAISPAVEEHEVDMETQEESPTEAEEDDLLAETELGADVSKKGRYTRAGIICTMVVLSLVLLFVVYGIVAPGSAQKERILGTTPLFVDVDVGGNESEAIAVQDELHVIDIPLDF